MRRALCKIGPMYDGIFKGRRKYRRNTTRKELWKGGFMHEGIGGSWISIKGWDCAGGRLKREG